MRRDRLDPEMDLIFTKKLTNPSFLRSLLKTLKQESNSVDRERLNNQLQGLASRRQRILDSYFEGIINPTERDTRLADIERERKIASNLLARQPVTFDVDRLAKVFRAFVSFDQLKRDRKRTLLNAITPEIIVKDYFIEGLSLGTGESLRDMGSWLPLT